jgi:hypothetical protein
MVQLCLPRAARDGFAPLNREPMQTSYKPTYALQSEIIRHWRSCARKSAAHQNAAKPMQSSYKNECSKPTYALQSETIRDWTHARTKAPPQNGARRFQQNTTNQRNLLAIHIVDMARAHSVVAKFLAVQAAFVRRRTSLKRRRSGRASRRSTSGATRQYRFCDLKVSNSTYYETFFNHDIFGCASLPSQRFA